MKIIETFTVQNDPEEPHICRSYTLRQKNLDLDLFKATLRNLSIYICTFVCHKNN